MVRPRLADAEFFFNTDRKRPLIDRLPELEQAIFQKATGYDQRQNRPHHRTCWLHC
ncbi:glycine--tRNA ligase subunit beta [Vibrio parahaemolyticus]|uniref:glycine--tRNA ligase subunit beta n=1 Tax=Vibrio parahaemolyticus TaxID=670 RepID=UPI001EEF3822|nr:glycine--tRNA ligase subunit beta [Vibrio parahaemolyticus]